jgi:hypothetical protein
MSRVAGGALLGVVAAALAVVGHVAGGGQSAAVMTAVLVVASALLFAAVAEVRAPMWALVALGALVQIAGHLLLAPLGGHAGVGAHAHGMPGQVRTGNLDTVVTHLASGSSLMLLMHALSFAALVVVLAVGAPLAGMLIRLHRILVVSHPPVDRQRAVPVVPTLSGFMSPLQHIVVRRGPPALV